MFNGNFASFCGRKKGSGGDRKQKVNTKRFETVHPGKTQRESKNEMQQPRQLNATTENKSYQDDLKKKDIQIQIERNPINSETASPLLSQGTWKQYECLKRSASRGLDIVQLLSQDCGEDDTNILTAQEVVVQDTRNVPNYGSFCAPKRGDILKTYSATKNDFKETNSISDPSQYTETPRNYDAHLYKWEGNKTENNPVSTYQADSWIHDFHGQIDQTASAGYKLKENHQDAARSYHQITHQDNCTQHQLEYENRSRSKVLSQQNVSARSSYLDNHACQTSSTQYKLGETQSSAENKILHRNPSQQGVELTHEAVPAQYRSKKHSSTNAANRIYHQNLTTFNDEPTYPTNSTEEQLERPLANTEKRSYSEAASLQRQQTAKYYSEEAPMNAENGSCLKQFPQENDHAPKIDTQSSINKNVDDVKQKIMAIWNKVHSLIGEIGVFNGDKSEYSYIEESLTRLLLKLDELHVQDIETKENRKSVIKYIYYLLDCLESRNNELSRAYNQAVAVNQI